MNNPNFLKLFKKFFRVLHCGKQERFYKNNDSFCSINNEQIISI